MIVIKPSILRIEDTTTILPQVPVKRSPHEGRIRTQ